jgi:hypothetical protein
MRQDEIDAANEAVQLIAAQKYFLEKSEPPTNFDTKTKTITLYYDDVKDIYHCYLIYEKQLKELQELLNREIKLTGKSYSVRSNGVLSQEALIDAINLIKSNQHNLANKHGR